MLSEVFYSMLVSSTIILIMNIVKIISKSRCDQFECLGCFKVHRAVDLETLEISRNETKENSI